MSTFLSTSTSAQVDLRILRRDFFDGFSLLLQNGNGLPIDLTDTTVCASIQKVSASGTVEIITSLNIEKEEPLSAGRIRFWLSSAQTAQVWDAYQSFFAGFADTVFFPTAYTGQAAIGSLAWDVRIENQEPLADLISVSSGVFLTQVNHTLGSSERVIFKDTTQPSINYNGTSSTIYTGLTNITYEPPYSFAIASLSGVTNPAIGGSVYRLRQDTVVTGSVAVGSTISNCFP